MFGFILSPVLLIILLVVALLIFLMVRYRIGKPDEALIVTGSLLGKEGIKILKNSGTFVIPIIQKAHKLSLLTHKLEIGTPEVYTEQGVPIKASATVLVKVGNSTEAIKTAAEQYLGKSTDELEDEAKEVLEGHLRAILGTMTVEAIYKNRDDFAEQVQNVASTDLKKMGLEIVSFTIKDVSDPNGYLDALGRPQIAEVKKNAEVAESNALRETRIKQAENEQLAQHEEIRRKTEIAEANKDMALKQAQYQQEQEVAQAQAEQVAVAEKMKVNLIEQDKNIEIQAKQAELTEKELNATLRKKAEADKYVVEQNALADKAREIARAEAEAEKVRLATQAEAERIEKLGSADAEKIAKVGQAEAESREKMAIALTKLNEAGILMEFIKVLPAIAKEVNAPLSNIDKVVSFGSGDGLPEMGQAGLARTFETIKETTGLDLVTLINDSMSTRTGNRELVAAVTEAQPAPAAPTSAVAEKPAPAKPETEKPTPDDDQPGRGSKYNI
ncbi:flotillin family protein [Enterococcus diestrammenae]|uniref:Flotillin n=1 Tax=Enterococcus diestrammenae TaxID=1155073 RepID=A0ABV0EZS1_9ENTE|nr:flotillin family protein [Enterococcus diestrammenae]KAF1298521.1 flotillin [Enterococcus diestrammenae]